MADRIIKAKKLIDTSVNDANNDQVGRSSHPVAVYSFMVDAANALVASVYQSSVLFVIDSLFTISFQFK